MPEGLSAGEQWVYQSIALLAARCRLKAISDEQALYEAAEIRKAYAKVETFRRDTVRQAEFWRDVEDVTTAYAKDRTPENAETMYKVCVGLMRL